MPSSTESYTPSISKSSVPETETLRQKEKAVEQELRRFSHHVDQLTDKVEDIQVELRQKATTFLVALLPLAIIFFLVQSSRKLKAAADPNLETEP